MNENPLTEPVAESVAEPAAEPAAPDTTEAAARVWAVMRNLVLEHGDRRKEVSDALDMSFFRAKALRRLRGGPLTMRELATGLVSDKAYTTLIVDDLERRELVARTVHPDDRRYKLVTLTPAGLLAATRAEQILARPPAAMLDLAPEELATLERLLTGLLES
ncbi:hypothetical protein GCM10009665_38370 [Kitasatospora nipponensis]|uniref:HTH marR-type domain-containing protein n=1 Tax=Kitasatospora nipponensis TaxID=258049 RepID=A0ABN1WC02_9ACTN